MDSDHLRVVVDANGEAERELPADRSTAATRQPTAMTRPAHALPTDRMRFDTQVAALRAYVTASNRGERAVGAGDIAARLSVAEATAALVNNFFVGVGLLTKEGKGRYKPVADVCEYAREYSLDREKARHQLAEVLMESWCFEAIFGELSMGEQSEEVLISVLARAVGTGGERRQQLTLILDWLEYATLIERGEDGKVRLIPDVDGSVPASILPVESSTTRTETPVQPSPQGESRTESARTTQTGGASPKVLGFDFTFSLTADDLKKLSSEQITALFAAVGNVMAIKAAMNE